MLASLLLLVPLAIASSLPLTESQVVLGGHINNGNYFTDHFDKRVAALLDRFKVPGISIAILDGNETYAKGYGIASGIGGDEIKVTPETLFYIGSLSKAFTSAAMSFLVDNASLPEVQWTTPIQSLIREEFVLSDERWTPLITIEDALSHRSGLFTHDISYGDTIDSTEKVVRNLRNLDFAVQPRSQFIYNNMMYSTMTYLIETITKTSLGSILRDRIWRPLGMESTYYDLNDATQSGKALARGYYWDVDHYVEIDYMIAPELDGAGGIISNVVDYAKWLRMMLNKDAPLSASAHSELTRPRSLPPRLWDEDATILNPTYALGWGNQVFRNVTIITHEGGLFGFGTKSFFSPQLKKGMVAFANTRETSNQIQQVLLYDMLDEWLGIPQDQRYDWEANAWRAYKDIQANMNATAAREALFPSSQPRLPATLPISGYAGTFFNAGYRNITLSQVDNKTLTGALNRAWPVNLTVEHATGDFFFVAGANSKQKDMAVFTKAEFHVNSKGEADRLGLTLDEVDEKVLQVRFDRVE